MFGVSNLYLILTYIWLCPQISSRQHKISRESG